MGMLVKEILPMLLLILIFIKNPHFNTNLSEDYKVYDIFSDELTRVIHVLLKQVV